MHSCTAYKKTRVGFLKIYLTLTGISLSVTEVVYSFYRLTRRCKKRFLRF